MHDKKGYFIDFFAPWCPPCMKLLPEWRKAGRQIGDRMAKFGTVDCTAHRSLCQDVSLINPFLYKIALLMAHLIQTYIFHIYFSSHVHTVNHYQH